MSLITPVDEKSFVKIKKGKREGSKIFAQTKTPFNETCAYFAGFITINMIITRKNKPKIKDLLFKNFLVCLTILFIISYYMRVDIEKELIQRAKVLNKTIVFPEADFSDRIIIAVKNIIDINLAKVVLIGNKESLKEKLGAYYQKVKVVDQTNYENFSFLANKVYLVRKEKGLSLNEAEKLLLDPIYFANAYVLCGYADGIVCGAEVATAKTLRPALQLIKSKKGLVSSYFLFVGKNSVTDNAFLMGDCGVVENPSAVQECLIAESMLNEFQMLGLKNPKIAFLSYSTLNSANSGSTQKVKDATNLFKQNNQNVDAVGEVQFDASINKDVAKVKMPNIQFLKPANIFVMPNIDAGNICYKMVQYFGNLKAIGPITMGFNKPVNDLSRGCTPDEIILLTAITCLQCQ